MIHVYMFIYDSEQLYDHRYEFGRPHRSNRRKSINKVKKYDGAMLRRVHRLYEELKYEMNPKIRRELRIKYKELKKELND